jgi:hypothetical protein
MALEDGIEILGVGSREMAINWHSIHLGFRMAARNPGSGWRRPYLIEF